MAGGIVRSVLVVSSLSLVQLVSQFALQMLLAKRFGAGFELDAFNAALVLPTTINTILTVSLGYILIPWMAGQFAGDVDSKSAWRLASAAGTWVILISLILSAALSLGADIWIGWLYSGFQAETAELSSSCLRILGWQLVLGATVSWLNSIENARSGFIRPSLVALIAAMVNLVLAYYWLSSGIFGYAWSILVSGLVQVLVLWSYSFGRLAKNWTWRDPRMSSMFVQWLPLLIGGTYVRLDPIVDRVVGSYLEEGSIAHLGYAQRFIQALVVLATGGLLTVLFPKLSSADPESTKRELSLRMRRSLHGMGLVLFPIVIGGGLFAYPATRDLLERGQFLPEDTQVVASMFRVLLWMFAGASLADLLAKAFYTLGDTRTPTIIGALGISFSFAAKLALTEKYGVSTIVWSTSIYCMLVALALGWVLSRRAGAMIDRVAIRGWGISLIAIAGACVVAGTLEWSIGRNSTWIGAPLAAAVYVSLLLAMKEPMVIEMLSRKRHPQSS